jgi:hypothetical protein
MIQSQIGKYIIRWGCGQSPADVAQTMLRTQQIDQLAVLQMIQRGLTRSWVEGRLASFCKARDLAGPKLINVQLLPRIELLRTILKNWP